MLSFIYSFFKLTLKLFNKNTYSLDIHITTHCNLKCKGCLHYSPIAEPLFIDLNSLKNSILKCVKITSFFKVINILGGEPLLHPDIISIIKIVRETFAKNEIRIITNGILIKRMKDDFWTEIKNNNIKILITKYPVIDLNKIESFLKEKNINYQIFGDRSLYWLSCLLNNYKKNSISHFIKCKDNQFSWQLMNDKIIFCGKAAFSDFLNKKYNTNFKIEKRDYILLNNKISKLKLWIFAFKPKKFCGYCKFPQKIINWEHSSLKKEEWINS